MRQAPNAKISRIPGETPEMIASRQRLKLTAGAQYAAMLAANEAGREGYLMTHTPDGDIIPATSTKG